ncbi:hypothetical protein I4F81_003941 [Pyropia yezoensis]|uniref:Uncharacterized protein n=1 Tax=Pyropia yezoensis TaxID=2788 RepID=A0ACC3BV01_PYRYE|nr:hypothetical protein I4F81_003941 [Neopyropia yezoensis]
MRSPTMGTGAPTTGTSAATVTATTTTTAHSPRGACPLSLLPSDHLPPRSLGCSRRCRRVHARPAAARVALTTAAAAAAAVVAAAPRAAAAAACNATVEIQFFYTSLRVFVDGALQYEPPVGEAPNHVVTLAIPPGGRLGLTGHRDVNPDTPAAAVRLTWTDPVAAAAASNPIVSSAATWTAARVSRAWATAWGGGEGPADAAAAAAANATATPDWAPAADVSAAVAAAFRASAPTGSAHVALPEAAGTTPGGAPPGGATWVALRSPTLPTAPGPRDGREASAGGAAARGVATLDNAPAWEGWAAHPDTSSSGGGGGVDGGGGGAPSPWSLAAAEAEVAMEENILAAVDALYTPEPPTAGRPAGAARQPHPEWSAKEKGGGGGGGPPPQAVRGGPPTYGPLSEITMSMVSGGAADAGGGDSSVGGGSGGLPQSPPPPMPPTLLSPPPLPAGLRTPAPGGAGP